MSREENIATLNEHLDHWKRLLSEKICDQDEGEKTIDALQNAIKALEQEPCDDAISRQAVLDKMKERDEELSSICPRDIRDLPSVTPQQKMGRWILQPSNKEQGERDFIWWKCSECGQVIYSETEQDRRKYHAYCGMCGCKMQ